MTHVDDRLPHRPSWLPFLFLGALGTGCSGNLVLPPAPQQTCKSDTQCHATHMCVQGLCKQRPASFDCGPGYPNGRCPIGSACTATAAGIPTCIPVQCSPETPDGTCPTGQICKAGICTPSGSTTDPSPCPAGQVRDPDGECIDAPDCNDAQDCQQQDTFCSAARICLPIGRCGHADDCERLHVCNPMGACERRDACADDSACPPKTEYCSVQNICVPKGTCLAHGDCNENQKCSTKGQCIAQDACNDGSDCDSATEFCSRAGRCATNGSCHVIEDCNPGRICNASGTCIVLDNNTCTTNEISSDCADQNLSCCPAGETCCRTNERCADGGCVGIGACIDDGDCLADYFTCMNQRCTPTKQCPIGSECSDGERCTGKGYCLPSAGEVCASTADCARGERCNTQWQCEPDTTCGVDTFEATLVQPNMLVVFDRSGTMNECLPPTPVQVETTKWHIAERALTTVLDQNQDMIRFGLSTYPTQHPKYEACGTTVANSGSWLGLCGECTEGFCANWDVLCAESNEAECLSRGPCEWVPVTTQCRLASRYRQTDGDPIHHSSQPGFPDVPINSVDYDGKQHTNPVEAIKAALADRFPGGNTPTGMTFQNIALHREAFGLVSGDMGRDNYILLLTDGLANGSTLRQNGGQQPPCHDAFAPAPFRDVHDDVFRVDCLLNQLSTAPQTPVKTFVVGFAVTNARGHLNCHAVRGGTSLCGTTEQCSALPDAVSCENLTGCEWRNDQCGGGVGLDNCRTTNDVCYFRASKEDELMTAFARIADQVASCTYALSKIPADANDLYVYFQPDGSHALEPVKRDQSRTEGWSYDRADNKVFFHGLACERLLDRTATPTKPVVVYGCGPDPGG